MAKHLLILGPMLRNNKGFTLLEVLVAIAIFAVLSLAAYQILQGVLRSGEISKEHSNALTELQRAMLIIDQDFSQITYRLSRDENVEEEELQIMSAGESLFESEDQGIEFTRLGWTNPFDLLPRSELLRVRYRLKEGQLQRLYFLYPDLQVGDEPQEQVLLNDVEALSFRFWDGSWQDSWSSTDSLPDGIEISFTTKKYSEIRRVFIISADSGS